jgi:hypothetical protein
MHPALPHLPRQSPATPTDSQSITTTLYDLIAAIQTLVGTDDALVVSAVARLLRESRVVFVQPPHPLPTTVSTTRLCDTT